MKKLSNFERTSLNFILDGEEKLLLPLRSQVCRIEVTARETSPAGAYTYFDANSKKRALDGGSSFVISDVSGAASIYKNGFGLVLFVVDGILNTLEVFTYDDEWIGEPNDFELSYIDSKHRKLN